MRAKGPKVRLRPPPCGHCGLCRKHFLTRIGKPAVESKLPIRSKSFHLDTGCFDSAPEVDFFDRVIKDETTEKICFTGMLVHGQSGFQVYYIHLESHTVCNYHPDFLVYRTDGKAHLIEMKSNWKGELKDSHLKKLRQNGCHHLRLDKPERRGGNFEEVCIAFLQRYPEGRRWFEAAEVVDIDAVCHLMDNNP